MKNSVASMKNSVAGIKNSVAGNQVAVQSAMPHDWHPFGQSNIAKLIPKNLIPETAPDTSLNLKLLGILYFNSSNNSTGSSDSARALIVGPNMEEKGFRVQDILPGNVQIVAIYPDRVILKRNDKFETLRLPGQLKKLKLT